MATSKIKWGEPSNVQLLDQKTGQVYDLGEVVMEGIELKSDSKSSYEPFTGEFTASIATPTLRIWNIEAYKEQVFKFDGNAQPITIGEVWNTISRHNRRMIERQVKKGKNPKLEDYL
jgi:hypothetical protein